MTRIEHTKCPSCAHYRLGQFGPTPTCAKSTNPPDQAAVLAWERCEGRYFEAKR